MLPFNCLYLSVTYGALVLGLKSIQLLWSCLPHLKSPFFLLETHTEQIEGKQTMIVAFHECVSKPLSDCHCYLRRNVNWTNLITLYCSSTCWEINYDASNVKVMRFIGREYTYFSCTLSCFEKHKGGKINHVYWDLLNYSNCSNNYILV